MRLLIRRVMESGFAPDSHENRTRLGMLAGWTSTALSIILTLIKAWLGVVSGSISMLADATNNLTDAGTSLMIALSFQWSRKPRDEKHPFGHGGGNSEDRQLQHIDLFRYRILSRQHLHLPSGFFYRDTHRQS